MPLRLANRVKESTSTSGSGTITLAGANAGYQSFSAVLSSGDTTYYTIVNSNSWEVGIGTYASNTLSRSTILSSSNSNNKINLDGSSSVFIAYPSEKSVYKDQNNQVVVGSSGIILEVGIPSNTTNVLYNVSGTLYFNGSGIGGGGGDGSGIGNIVEDTSPQLGGNLDLNGYSITGIGNVQVNGLVSGINSIFGSGTYNSINLVANHTPVNVTGSLYNSSGYLYYQNNPVAILPTGGSAEQILQKVSSTGYDLQWINNYATEVSVYVKNTTSTTLTKGQAVYINSAQGDHPTIALAIANGEGTSSKTLGLLRQDLANNEFGYVITEGTLEGLNTNGANAGDPIWLSPTVSGGVIYGTGNKPLAPNHLVFIGYVIRKQINNGKVFIRVQNGFELDELHNVAVNGTSNGAFLQYNSTSGLWVASNSGTFTNVTVSGSISANSGVFTSGIQLNSGVPNNTTNLLYNNSGVLYFNGQSVVSRKEYQNISSNTTLSSIVDIVFIDSSVGQIDVYLPVASGNGGKEIKFKRSSGNNLVVLHPSGSEHIDGNLNFTIFHAYESITLTSNNSNWFIT